MPNPTGIMLVEKPKENHHFKPNKTRALLKIKPN
jgi:hypothetical protein